jgi:rhamnose transport system permease protein
MTAITPVKSGGTAFGNIGRRILRARETGILGAFVLIVLITTIVNPAFLFSTDGWRDLLLSPAILVLVSVGEALVIITRNVDLSVGSVVGLTAYLAGELFVGFPGIPIVLVFVLTILGGAVLGLVNGLLVAFGKVPALVITLGTLYAYRGIAVVWAGSNRLSASQMPKSFLALGSSSLVYIPYLFLFALIVVLIAGWYLRNRRSGRELYAIGSDPAAAELYGLRVTRRIIFAFVVSGALAGFGGILSDAFYGTTDSQTGTGFELQAVGAVVIGGVAIFGGSGSIYGAAIGAMLLFTINRALPILGIGSFWQQAVTGVLIIGAIVLDRALAVRTSRRLSERQIVHD